MLIRSLSIISSNTRGYERSALKSRYELYIIFLILVLPFFFASGYIVSVEDTIFKYIEGDFFLVVVVELVSILEECLQTGVVYIRDKG